MAGSVSGGCVEGAVFEEAQSVLAGGPSKLLYYGIADDLAWNVGLTCGGEIWVWLEAYHGWPVPAERSARVTVVEGADAGRHLLVTHEGRAAGDLDGDLVDAAIAAGQEAIEPRAQRDGRGARRAALRRGARAAASTRRRRRRRHRRVALPHGQRARLADRRRRSARHVRDRRARALGRPARRRWPGAGYDELGLGPADAVVVLTHDPKLDDPAITEAIRRDVGFIGALGSRRTQEKRSRAAARERPHRSELARVSGPVGLDIGAHTPEETAVSILAEVIASRSGRDGGRLISGSGGIHADRREPRGSRPEPGVLR